MRTLITGGTIVTASDIYEADVLIEDEKILGIGSGFTADRTIDARGKYVIPGGIDVHTHLDMPFGGTVASDDFFTGHRAAAFGGTTMHVDFAIQPKGASLRETLDQWHGRANGKAVIDYGFHLAITDLTDAVMKEISKCPEYGVASLKLFMAYKGALMVDDATLFRAMQQAAKHDLLIMVHAENGDAIDILVAEALAAGQTEPKYGTRQAETSYRLLKYDLSFQHTHLGGPSSKETGDARLPSDRGAGSSAARPGGAGGDRARRDGAPGPPLGRPGIYQPGRPGLAPLRHPAPRRERW